jgi:predicted NAD/FAD-binding protein
LFEKAARIGVDDASVSVSVINNEGKSVEVGIDVPMRSIDAGTSSPSRPQPFFLDLSFERKKLRIGYYPRLLSLLKDVDVAVRPDDLTFAFSRDTSHRIPYLIYNGLSGFQGLSVPSTNSHLQSILEIIYHSFCFIYLCIISLLHYHLHLFPRIKEITFEEFCNRYCIPGVFARDVLVPLYSSVCTCKEQDVLKYPAGLIIGRNRAFILWADVDYVAAVFGTRHYAIASPRGFKAVVAKLLAPIATGNVHTSTSISRISGTRFDYTLHSGTTSFGPFNHIILATPAPVSSNILSSMPTISKSMHTALSKFKYIPTLVITHTDPSFIPSDPSLHRDLHFQRPTTPVPSLCKLTNYTQATHILHYRSPHLTSTKLYQTTNPHRFPKKGTVLGQTWFERYLPSLESLKVRKEIFEGPAQGAENVWFVGSWVAEGVPLLEGCVVSAEKVVEKILAYKNVSHNVS